MMRAIAVVGMTIAVYLFGFAVGWLAKEKVLRALIEEEHERIVHEAVAMMKKEVEKHGGIGA